MDASFLKIFAEDDRGLDEILKPRSDRLCYFNKGEVVCRQDEDFNCVYIVLSGLLEARYTLSSGQVSIISSLGKGDLIGDIEFALGCSCVCEVVARNKSSLMYLNKDQYRNLLYNNMDFNLRVNRQLASKLLASMNKSLEYCYIPVRYRILKLLYELVRDFDFNKRVSFITEFPRQEMANKLGITARSVNRILKSLKDEQIIYTSKRHIIMNETSRTEIMHELNQQEFF